jgi:hypothetical protein
VALDFVVLRSVRYTEKNVINPCQITLEQHDSREVCWYALFELGLRDTCRSTPFDFAAPDEVLDVTFFLGDRLCSVSCLMKWLISSEPMKLWNV